MAFPVTINGRTYTLADFEGTNYVDGFPDALEDFVTQAGDIYNSTSTSSVAIGTGSKSFTTADSGKPYQPGTPLRIADAVAPATNFMDCIVTSYSGTSLVVDSIGFGGSGTKSSWTINIGGAKTVDGTLAVNQGGTGATTASAARTNLDVYSKTEADNKFLDVSGEASNVTINGSTTMNGDVTIGDAGADTLTVNATATLADATLTTADINGGTIDGVTIGGASAGAGTFTTGQFNTSINVDGTVTADGLTVDGDIKSQGTAASVLLKETDITDQNTRLRQSGGDFFIQTINDAENSAQARFSVDHNTGNISFYEDTGTTPQFRWNAADERLRVGDGDTYTGEVTADNCVGAFKKNLSEVSFRVIARDYNVSTKANLDLANFASKNLGVPSGYRISGGVGSGAGTENNYLSFSSIALESDGTITEEFEAMRIDSSGNLLVGTTNNAVATQNSDTGVVLDGAGGRIFATANSHHDFNRTADGEIFRFRSATVTEGNISVSGGTVTLNGAHLSRWSRLTDDSKDASILRGTVMTNLDEMVVWSHDAVEAQDAVYETVTIPAEYDEDGNEVTPETTEERLVSEAVEAKEAYTEDNEQLNKMAISSVEGDPNVAGVFSNWDDEDDFNDLVVAMTGDFVIRIAQGTTVQRGDLLMSAGDGTAKPQGDDIVRSKTIAKVTSTHVSHTYDDGSYLVPCVLMAC